MPAVTARNLMCAYPELLKHVFNGKHAAPRGNNVLEVPEPIVWTLHHPEEWALLIPGRRINPFFALAEVVWMWSGKGGAEFITYYNKKIGQFLDPGIPYFNAAYGKRVRHAGYSEQPFRDTPFPRTNGEIPEPCEVDQLDFVISKLRNDPATRQAAVCLWDVIKDNFHVSKDYPCNNMLYFSNRHDSLNISVVIRSNDVVWGTPYNMIQFSHLQALIAGTLDLEVGWFAVLCNNLHMYDNLYPYERALLLKWVTDVSNGTAYSTTMFDDIPDMRWTLSGFDNYVRAFWEPLERQLRSADEQFCQMVDARSIRAHGAHLNTLLHKMQHSFESQYVPEYWRQLFTVLFMYHLRKAKQMELFKELLNGLHTMLFWAVSDFIGDFKQE